MLLVTTLGVMVAVVGVAFAYLTYRQGEETAEPRTSVSADGGITPSATNSDTHSSTRPSVTGTGLACGSPISGESMDCFASGSAALIEADPCDMVGVFQAWGLDATLDALDLSVSARSGKCWVGPGKLSAQAGAHADDVLEVANGAVADSLRQCARGNGMAAASCATPHEVEWIGAWFPRVATDDATERCRQRTVAYTRMTVAGLENRLVAGFAERQVGAAREMRCLVRVEGVSLNGSLRDLKNGQLPLA